MQNQFRFLLDKAGLTEANGGRRHSLYSLRHTAICLRLLHSKGQVNLLNLAKNARTSVSQIERFYASQLPMSAPSFWEKGDFVPREITELAGAIATREATAGNRRKARRLFLSKYG